MGLAPNDSKVETWIEGKSRTASEKKKKKENELEEETGCWVKLKFIGSCIPSRSKVDSSLSGSKVDSFISGTSTHCGKLLLLLVFVGFCQHKFETYVIVLEIGNYPHLFVFLNLGYCKFGALEANG